MNENQRDPENEKKPLPEEEPFSDTLILEDFVQYPSEEEEQGVKPKKKRPQPKKKQKPKSKREMKAEKKAVKKRRKQKNKEEKKKKKFFSPLFIVLLVCFIVVFSWVGYVSAYVVPLIWGDLGGSDTKDVPQETQVATFEKGQFTILMMGSDARYEEEASRSDTLMIAYVDLNNSMVRLVSIPRDTYVTLPTGWRTKINHAYAQGGMDETIETLKDNFDINIDYTAIVDFQGFRDVIDALGGVTIDVPMDMDYAAEGIDLKAGLQTLDGDQSLQFCRFRNDGQGDLGRIERQQLFMTTLKDQLLSMGTLLKIPDVCSAIKNNVDTNLTGKQLLQIMMQLGNGFDMVTVEPPGEGRYGDDGISYYFLYEDDAKAFFDAVNSYQPTAQEQEEQGKTTDSTEDTSEESNETSGT